MAGKGRPSGAPTWAAGLLPAAGLADQRWLCPDGRLHLSAYFEEEVLRKRPYLEREWCIRVLEAPIRVEQQENNRWRYWAAIPEFGGRYLRVVTLDDRTTIHNAFPDRGFTPCS